LIKPKILTLTKIEMKNEYVNLENLFLPMKEAEPKWYHLIRDIEMAQHKLLSYKLSISVRRNQPTY